MSMDPMAAPHEPDPALDEEQEPRVRDTEYPGPEYPAAADPGPGPELAYGDEQERGHAEEPGVTDRAMGREATGMTGGMTTGMTGGMTHGVSDDVVFAPDQNTGFRTRWREIQAEFIDDPQQAAKDADHLVSEITRAFAHQAEERRTRLSSSWQQDGPHGTEDLRLVMRQYRGLVDHMLDQ